MFDLRKNFFYFDQIELSTYLEIFSFLIFFILYVIDTYSRSYDRNSTENELNGLICHRQFTLRSIPKLG